MEWQILKNEILFEHMEETIAAEIFRGKTYPWEVLPEIGAFIQKLGKTLSEEEYEKRGEDIWIAKSAKVFPTVYLIKYRCLIIIMWVILFWGTSHIWAQVPLPQM